MELIHSYSMTNEAHILIMYGKRSSYTYIVWQMKLIYLHSMINEAHILMQYDKRNHILIQYGKRSSYINKV